MGVIPIVNENDTLAVSEIKFGDNDTLSAITAAMVHADLLFLMTDVDCLYDKNPRTNPDAQPIEVIDDISALVADGSPPPPPPPCPNQTNPHPVSQAGSSLGTGGMSTKIVAARLATSAGVTTVITRSSNPGNIIKIVQHIQGSRSPASLVTTTQANATTSDDADDDQHDAIPNPLVPTTTTTTPATEIPLHTRFLPSPHPVRDRYFWILYGLTPHGTLYIDAGAYRALQARAGLLPVGVLDVEGTFAQQEAVKLCVVTRSKDSEKGWEGPAVEVGRALVNYASFEIARAMGHQSAELKDLLGYADSEYVAQRESISLFRRESRPATPSWEAVGGLMGAQRAEGDGGVDERGEVAEEK